MLRTAPSPTDASRGGRLTIGLAARGLGALSLLTVGAVHLQQYLDLYSAIPTIGTLFLLNFTSATIVGVGLLAPVERLLGRLAVVLLALAGIAQAATGFVFLWISERTPLFGFMEPGYDPTAILGARIAEVATIVFLGTSLMAGIRTRSRASSGSAEGSARSRATRPKSRAASRDSA